MIDAKEQLVDSDPYIHNDPEDMIEYGKEAYDNLDSASKFKKIFWTS